MKKTGIAICLPAFALILVCMASAETQEFGLGDVGTIRIEIPYRVEPDQYSSSDMLSLVRVGMTTPIMTIFVEEPRYENLEEFAKSYFSEPQNFDKKTTKNGNDLLVHGVHEGVDNKGKPIILYRGYIDYTDEKGKYILIHTNNKVKDQSGDTIATFDDGTFANICRSFAII